MQQGSLGLQMGWLDALQAILPSSGSHRVHMHLNKAVIAHELLHGLPHFQIVPLTKAEGRKACHLGAFWHLGCACWPLCTSSIA
jgi:hypothetical protein